MGLATIREAPTLDGGSLVKLLGHDDLAVGERRIVTLDGRDVAVYRLGEREYHALDTVCPHKGGPLGEGAIECEPSGRCTVTCGWHGWEYDIRTGDSVSDNEKLKDAVPLHAAKWPLVVRDDGVWAGGRVVQVAEGMANFYDQLARITLFDGQLPLKRGLARSWSLMEADDALRAQRAGEIARKLSVTSILEVAGAYGFVTARFRHYCPEASITVLEIAPTFCAVQRAAGYANEVVEGDLRTADLGGRTWELVTLMQTLEHMPDPYLVLQQLRRWSNKYVFLEIPLQDGSPDGDRHVHVFDREGTRALLLKYCSRIVEEQEVPPQGLQKEHSYSGMLQLVGEV